MNGLTPNCLDDFLFSNANERKTLELILQRKLPFPFGGKSGILLHGTWGTGKSTLAKLLPALLETAYSKTWDKAKDVGQMPAPVPDHCQTVNFRCGGGLSSTDISQTLAKFNNRMPMWHFSQHDYFVFDEFEKLTIGAQQSLRSVMDLPRSMYFFSTNYLSKIDPGIINRCHLVEMNQITTPSAYVPLGKSILQNMGVTAGVVNDTTLQSFATRARGSLRDFTHDVVMEGIKNDGLLPC
jgi:DNA polymerase III delta prime subunit